VTHPDRVRQGQNERQRPDKNRFLHCSVEVRQLQADKPKRCTYQLYIGWTS